MTAERPLEGVRVAVTRPHADDDDLVRLLRERGADVVVLPLVDVGPAPDASALDAAAAEAESYDWIVFTSANGVRYFRDALERSGRAGRPPAARTAIAAVGPATARAVTELLGWRVDAVPGRYTGADLPAAMGRVRPVHGSRVLWPKAAEAREALPRELAAAGAVLDAPDAYITVPVPDNAAELVRRLAGGQVDVVTLTSPSAARCLAAAGPDPGPAVFAVIGPSTGEAARLAGLPVHVEPDVHTLRALVDALSRHFSRTYEPIRRPQDDEA